MKDGDCGEALLASSPLKAAMADAKCLADAPHGLQQLSTTAISPRFTEEAAEQTMAWYRRKAKSGRAASASTPPGEPAVLQQCPSEPSASTQQRYPPRTQSACILSESLISVVRVDDDAEKTREEENDDDDSGSSERGNHDSHHRSSAAGQNGRSLFNAIPDVELRNQRRDDMTQCICLSGNTSAAAAGDSTSFSVSHRKELAPFSIPTEQSVDLYEVNTDGNTAAVLQGLQGKSEDADNVST